ncbi:glycosyl transferase family A [Bordetella genomosp. 1]|uniref:Glycosyl transferase family A n=1 Tax=Bordetella genomosp. 1 TaxID=1395607 RepID=A0A261SFK0_9BORD|nr:glycosyltransferase family A protein [Bordetella genomosp. 1]OZI35722.1 glycosyl transferase family A [Bordetella genomosp. 1]
MLRTTLLNLYQRRVHGQTWGESAHRVYLQGPEDPVLLNRIGLFDTSRNIETAVSEKSLARARAALEWDPAIAPERPAAYKGRVSDHERRQYALALARLAPARASGWLRPAERELALAAALAVGDLDHARWLAIRMQMSESMKNSINLHAMFAALHTRQGDNRRARKHLMHVLTDQRIELPDRAAPMKIEDLVAACQGRPVRPAHPGPLISVIICAYNAAPHIRSALHSVLSQSYRNVEIIAIDDGSTDNTFLHMQEMADLNPRINTARIENSGVYAARNMGLRLAKGELITFLDADDIMLPLRLEQQADRLLATGAGAVVSRLLRITPHGVPVAPRVYPLVRHNPSSIMLRRSVVAVTGGFEEVRYGADEEFEHRMQLYLGRQGIVRDTAVQTIALHHADSLTQRGDSGLQSEQGRRARIRYREDWVRRHAQLASHRPGSAAR